jgi:YVTN family beta-propeller protein
MGFPHIMMLAFIATANFLDDSVTWGRRTFHIDEGSGPRDLIYNSEEEKLYIVNSKDQSLYIFPDSAWYRLPGEPRGAALIGKDLYIVIKDLNQVVVLDTRLEYIKRIIPVGLGPRNIAFSPDKKTFYVTNNEESTLSIVTGDHMKTIPTPLKPYAVAAFKNKVVVTCLGKNELFILEGRKTSIIPSGLHPTAVVFNPLKDEYYVANMDEDTVAVYAYETDSLIGTIKVGKNPFGLALSENHLAVTNNGDASVSIIDINERKVVDTLPVGNDPHGIVFYKGINYKERR